MPNTKSKTKSSGRGDKQLSTRTKKQIDSLPKHAQHIYKKAHASAIEQYQSPITHKAAWAAVKKKYNKEGNEWVKKVEA
jgi:cation transport regulator